MNNNESIICDETQFSELSDGTEDVNSVLRQMHSEINDIKMSLVATIDGINMTALGLVSDELDAGAMCTELLNVCNKTARELQQGDVNEILIRCSLGNILMVRAGEYAVLALITKSDMNLGLLFIEANRTAQQILKCF